MPSNVQPVLQKAQLMAARSLQTAIYSRRTALQSDANFDANPREFRRISAHGSGQRIRENSGLADGGGRGETGKNALNYQYWVVEWDMRAGEAETGDVAPPNGVIKQPHRRRERRS